MRGPRLLLVLLLLTAFTLTALDARSGDGSPFDGAAPRRRRRARPGAAGARRRRLAVVGTLSAATPTSRPSGCATRTTGCAPSCAAPTTCAAGVARARRAARPHGRRQLPDGPGAGDRRRVGVRLRVDGDPRRRQPRRRRAGADRRRRRRAGRTDAARRAVHLAPCCCSPTPGSPSARGSTREGTSGSPPAPATALELALVEGGAVAEGDALLTTGSDTFVPGVPVGRVTSVERRHRAGDAPRRSSRSSTSTSLDLVGVVTAPPRSTPRVPLEPAAP